MDQKAQQSHHKWKQNNMFIATWNVRSLYQPGASRMLEEELEKYKVDIAAIQEIRWKSTEIVELKKYVLINSGNERNKCGTGFMISKKLKGNSWL
jgi:exonuclease III